MEYDEIRISTRREISICRDAIRELEKTINGFAEKYGSPGTELPGDTRGPDTMAGLLSGP